MQNHLKAMRIDNALTTMAGELDNKGDGSRRQANEFRSIVDNRDEAYKVHLFDLVVGDPSGPVEAAERMAEISQRTICDAAQNPDADVLGHIVRDIRAVAGAVLRGQGA